MEQTKINLTELSNAIQAYKEVKPEYRDKHFEIIEQANKDLPSGSGLDAGCKIEIHDSSSEKVVIIFGFHHLNEGGYYDGWTEHTLTVKPKFGGFSLHISGKDRNQIKDYLYDLFRETFSI